MTRVSRWKKAIIGGAAVSAMLGLILVEENVRGQMQLKRYRDRLIASGEKLTTRELAPAIPAEQEANAAVIEGAGKTLDSLRKQCPMIESFPALCGFTGPGKARIMFNEVAPKLSLTLPSREPQVLTWEELHRQLDVGRPALETAKAALKKPAACKIEYDKGVAADVPGANRGCSNAVPNPINTLPARATSCVSPPPATTRASLANPP